MRDLKYPKQYATIQEVLLSEKTLVVKVDATGEIIQIPEMYHRRRGKGSFGTVDPRYNQFTVGARVKVWYDDRGHIRFSKIGS